MTFSESTRLESHGNQGRPQIIISATYLRFNRFGVRRLAAAFLTRPTAESESKLPHSKEADSTASRPSKTNKEHQPPIQR
jgi:hypothetical protein